MAHCNKILAQILKSVPRHGIPGEFRGQYTYLDELNSGNSGDSIPI